MFLLSGGPGVRATLSGFSSSTIPHQRFAFLYIDMLDAWIFWVSDCQNKSRILTVLIDTGNSDPGEEVVAPSWICPCFTLYFLKKVLAKKMVIIRFFYMLLLHMLFISVEVENTGVWFPKCGVFGGIICDVKCRSLYLN